MDQFWKISKKVFRRGSSIDIVMEGRPGRRRRVTTSAVKRFHSEHVDLRHSMADESSQHASSADFGLAKLPDHARSLYALVGQENVSSASSVTKWSCRAKQLNRVTACLPTGADFLKSFSPLLLDAFHALWDLYFRTRDNVQPAPTRKLYVPLSPAEALHLFPIITLIETSPTKADSFEDRCRTT